MGLKQTTPYDPFIVFRGSRTPPGVYARRRWLGESSKAWVKDFRQTVQFLKAGQEKDGSWNNSPLETTRRLFGLHLTIRDPDDVVDRGLDWLTERLRSIRNRRPASPGVTLRDSDMRGLPFSNGKSLFFLAGATLFLSTIFGRERDSFVLSSYEWLDALGQERSGRWCGRSCSSNILRAFVVHPVYAQKESVSLALRELGAVQKQSGRWPRTVPFYQTVNALAHLRSRQADIQLQRAFQCIFRTQNRNGTWGRIDSEWKSFLVIHALKNKNVL